MRLIYKKYDLLVDESEKSKSSDVDELSVENLYLKVHQASLRQRRSDKNSKASDNLFSNYLRILEDLVSGEKKTVMKLYFLELATNIINFFLAFFLIFSVKGHLTVNESWMSVLWITSALALSTGISRYVSSVKSMYEFRIIFKTRQSLMILIYHKTILSSEQFLSTLTATDLHKLLYWHLEDFCSSPNVIHPAIRVTGWSLIYLSSVFMQPHVGFILYLTVAILVFFLGHHLSNKYCESYLEYRAILLKTRKTLHELVCSFKTIRHSSFQTIFKQRLEEESTAKLEVLKRIYWIDSMHSLNLSLFPFLAPVFLLTVVLVRHYSFLKSGGILSEDSGVSKFINYSYLVANICLSYYVKSQMKKFFYEVVGRKRKQVAIKYYDEFMNKETYLVRSIKVDPNLALGEVLFQNASVYFYQNSKKTNFVQKWLSDSGKNRKSKSIEKVVLKPNKKIALEHKIRQSRTLGVAGNNNRIFPMTQTASSGMKQMDLNEGSGVQYCKAIKKFTINIRSGEKVCLLWSEDRAVMVKSLIDLVLGETFSNGSICCLNGSVSFFSERRMPFVAGATIRDNILFGQAYSCERYELVTRLIGLSFDQYCGGDFYQVKDEGSNVQADDRLQILLARFLYKDSHIYVVEDLLLGSRIPTLAKSIDRVFNSFLKNKTIIFAANRPEHISWATSCVRFYDKGKYRVMTKEQIADFLGQPASSSMLNFTPEKITRIKNGMFFKNISFEEELVVHKKKQQELKIRQEKNIDKKKILEKLAYGISLVVKRRVEGRAHFHNEKMTIKDFSAFIKSDFRVNILKNRLFRLYSFVSYVEISLCIVLEYYLFRQTFEVHDLTLVIRRKTTLVLIMVYATIILLKLVTALIKRRLSIARSDSYQKRVSDKILNASYALINSHWVHELKAHACDNLQSIDIENYLGRAELVYIMLDLTTSMFCLMAVYSFLFASIILVVLAVIVFTVFKKVLRLYIRFLLATSAHQHQRNEFYYQLLKLVVPMRVLGMTQKLNNSFITVSDRVVTNQRIIMVNFKELFMRLNSIIQIAIGVAFVLMFMLFVAKKSLNLLGASHSSLLWSLTVTYRLVEKLDNLLLAFHSYFQELLSAFQVEKFLKTETEVISRNLPNRILSTDTSLSSNVPVYFKNVSLSLGYRIVLKKVSFKVTAKHRVGLFGLDTSGMSAIFDLILDLKTHDESVKSMIRLFGNEAAQCSAKGGQSKIRVLMKDAQLYEGSVRFNIDPLGLSSDLAIIHLLKSLGLEELLRTAALEQGKVVKQKKIAVERLEQLDLFIRKPLKTENRINDLDPQPAVRSFAEIKAFSTNHPRQNIFRKKLFAFKNNKSPFKRTLLTKEVLNLCDWQSSNKHNNELTILMTLDPPIHNKKESPPEIRIGQPDRPVDTGEKTGDNKGLQPTPRKVARSVTHRGEEKLGQNDNDSSSSSDEDGDTSIVGNQNAEDSALSGEKGDNLGENGLAPNLAEFLNIKVSFAGQNIEKSLRKVVSFARTILEQPKLLMIYEEALSWGNDVSSNLDILRARSPDTTVLAITQSNRGVLSYDQVLLLDGGMIIDQGDPVELIRREQSHFYNYLKETDREMFAQIRAQVDERQNKGDLRTKQHAEDRNPDSDEDSPKGR